MVNQKWWNQVLGLRETPVKLVAAWVGKALRTTDTSRLLLCRKLCALTDADIAWPQGVLHAWASTGFVQSLLVLWRLASLVMASHRHHQVKRCREKKELESGGGEAWNTEGKAMEPYVHIEIIQCCSEVVCPHQDSCIGGFVLGVAVSRW